MKKRHSKRRMELVLLLLAASLESEIEACITTRSWRWGRRGGAFAFARRILNEKKERGT
jgi:hypothetical protein